MEGTASLRRLFEPQVEQFGLSPDSDASLGCGSLFSGSTDRAEGWLWVCGLDDSCLVAVHDVTLRDDLALQEEGSCAICLASMTAATIETWFDRHAPERVAPSASENVVAFAQDRRPTEGLLGAGIRYASVSISCQPAFFERHGASDVYRLLDRELLRYGEKNGDCLTFDLPVELRTSLRMLAASSTRHDARSERLVRQQVGSSVATLASHLEAIRHARRDAGSLEQALLVMRAQNLIDGNLGRLVGIPELCARLHVGRTRLCSAFKAETGESLAAWARGRRIERAKELLAEGRLPVAEIARTVGYERPNSFDDLFRREVGVSPSTWARLRATQGVR